jgi:hypothetical protein
MSEYLCCEIGYPSLSTFRRVLSLGWYDGTTSGLAQCSQCSAAFKYDLIDWDSDQDRRMFAFSPIGVQEFEHVVTLLSRNEKPSWPFWFPKWQFTSIEKARVKSEIDERLARADPPEYLVASDRRLETVFAIKRLSGPARNRLPAVFDGLPVSSDFSYWREYVGLQDRK